MTGPRWWAPRTTARGHRPRRAHLVPEAGGGWSRLSALCQEWRDGWVELPADSTLARCRTCAVLGGAPILAEGDPRDEARKVGLVAARYCQDHDLGGDEPAEALAELLGMLLGRPREAAR